MTHPDAVAASMEAPWPHGRTRFFDANFVRKNRNRSQLIPTADPGLQSPEVGCAHGDLYEHLSICTVGVPHGHTGAASP